MSNQNLRKFVRFSFPKATVLTSGLKSVQLKPTPTENLPYIPGP